MKVGPVVLAENRLTNGNCAPRSRHDWIIGNTSCYSYCKVHDNYHSRDKQPLLDHFRFRFVAHVHYLKVDQKKIENTAIKPGGGALQRRLLTQASLL